MHRITLCACLVLFALVAGPVYAEAPRLVLQITVDQLRGDLPSRYSDRLGDGGFSYLFEQGVVYRNAHHTHANTETIVGHVTLATGTYPSIHGMVGNLWFDRETGFTTYNVEDSNYVLLTEGASVDADTEIDPTQAAARSEGRSPAAILVTTIADELRSSNAGRSKVVSVSVKDRGAISMAGHAGTAYWFSKSSGDFVTSSYYLDEYPEWVMQWNEKELAQQYAGTAWELLHDQGTYLFGDADDQEWETDLGGFGRVFPHPFGNADSGLFTTLLTLSPAGDELTLDFAKAALIGEQLGKDEVPDYLAVSFSSTDYVGHAFGPSSLEAEDNILRLDLALADLFAFVDEEVGLEHTLIVLSADHGSPEAPGYLNSLGIPAGYVEPESWDREAAIQRIKRQFRIRGKLFETYSHPYLYFSDEVINNSRIDLAALEAAVAEELTAIPGVSHAVSSVALRRNDLPDSRVYNAIARNFHPKRSGNLFIVFEPGWFINDFDGLTVTATHGSPWNYDTWVPIFFAGGEIEAQAVDRHVETVDVASTIATVLGIQAPSGAVGQTLAEVLARQ